MVNVVAHVGELLLKIGALVPVLHLVEKESFSRQEGILTIFSSDHLHGPGRGIVGEVKHTQAISWKILRGWNKVSKVDVGESPHELSNISCIFVVIMDVFPSQPVVNSVILELPVLIKAWVATDNNVKSNLRVVVDLFSASLNSSHQVGVPNCTAIHENVVSPLVTLEDSRN